MERKGFTSDDLYGPKAGPVMDPKPVAIPAGFRKPATMEERLKAFIRHEMSDEAARAGHETFDEANDFYIPDDPVDPSTPFEEFFDPDLGVALTPDELQRYDHIYRERYLAAQADAIKKEDREAALMEAVKEARLKRAAGGVTQPPPPPRPAEDPKTA